MSDLEEIAQRMVDRTKEVRKQQLARIEKDKARLFLGVAFTDEEKFF